MDLRERDAPYAIATWDFSWLERHGAGEAYADWDRVLDELVARGYDAVRIDPYPHLVAADRRGQWQIQPAFRAWDWGARDAGEIQVLPGLVEFVGKCADRDVAVALSSWFRADASGARMDIESPEELAEAWIATLESLERADLLDAVAWVDLCNEFPVGWAPFYAPDDDDVDRRRGEDLAREWITRSIAGVRERFPDLAYTVSETAGPSSPWGRTPVDGLDLLELHFWMMNTTSFFHWELLDHGLDSETHVEWLADRGQSRYREDPERWTGELATEIEVAADWSRRCDLPLATAESWGPVNYRDDPDLDWDWVKDVCAFGTRRAAETGRWVALATSNFCGPQFRGMWTDVEWHREVTDAIASASVDRE